MGFKLLPELPLFRRELTELANRRRTYVIRTIGAFVLCVLVFVTYSSVVGQWEQNSVGGGPTRYLGIGGWVFAAIVPLLFRSIQLLLPALCCASITMEKEQNTIGTLFLTRLSPWTIVFEKLCSRIVPMLTVLLLCAPVLAYVYSLGGVDQSLLIATFWLLLCECLLIASIAIMCSAWFSTTVSAFIWSYSLIACLAVLSASIGMVTFEPVAIWQAMFEQRPGGRTGWLLMSQPGNASQLSPFLKSALQLVIVLLTLVVVSIPTLVMSLFCLVVARAVLIRRAFVSHASILLKLFRGVDAFFTRLNDRTTGGIELVRDSNPLPEDDPVAWRECTKKSLGKARYLFRMVLFLEAPTLFICVMAAESSARNAFEGLYVLQGLLWALAAMIAAVKGATLFASERARETIEPLLASPMTTRELVGQKIDGSRRLVVALSIPLLTVSFTHLLLNIDMSGALAGTTLLRPLAYILFTILNVVVGLYLVVWTSMAVGLRIHSQTRAVLAAVVLIGIWVAIPTGLSMFVPPIMGFGSGSPRDLASFPFLLLSPASSVIYSEAFLIEPYVTSYSEASRQRAEEFPALIPAMVSLLVYSGILLLVRRFVLSMAPVMLDRRESQPRPQPVEVTASTAIPAAEGSS